MFLAIADLKIEIIPVTFIHQNCMLVLNKDRQKGVVVDPGGDIDKILSAIESCQMHVEAILLTHGHFDHVGGAMILQKKLKQKDHGLIPILGPSKEDAFLLDQVVATSNQFGFDLTGIQNVVPSRFVQDKEVLTFSGMHFEVIHVPGHTPGHVVFYEPNARVVITGDTLFKGTIGRSDFEYGNGALLLKTIKERLLTLGDDVCVLPGHGMNTTIGMEKKTNMLLKHFT